MKDVVSTPAQGLTYSQILNYLRLMTRAIGVERKEVFPEVIHRQYGIQTRFERQARFIYLS